MIDFSATQGVSRKGGLSEVLTKLNRRTTEFVANIWVASRPHLLRVGDSTVRLQLTRHTTLLAEWRPTWKTRLIGEMLKLHDGLFVDVGANLGQTLFDYLSSSHKHGYLGFDPLRECVEQLNRIVRDNHLNDCRIVQAALSDHAGKVELYRLPQQPADVAATLIGDLRPARPVVAESVPCYRFDEFWESQGLPKAGVIKIDVEGAELSVLSGMVGMIKRDQPWIICEVLDRDENADPRLHHDRNIALSQLIADLSYAIYRIGHDGSELILGFDRVTDFPTKAYDIDSQTQCDYILVPEATHLQICDKVLR